MSHRIIINSVVSNSGDAPTMEHISEAEYSFTFTPSHHLTESEQSKRVAKILRLLSKLAADVTASGESAD